MRLRKSVLDEETTCYSKYIKLNGDLSVVQNGDSLAGSTSEKT